MRIKFLRREIHETEGRNKGPVYEEGETYEIRDDRAQLWIANGVAEAAAPEAAVEKTKPETAKAVEGAPVEGAAVEQSSPISEDAQTEASDMPAQRSTRRATER